jgi:hypothetical protein
VERAPNPNATRLRLATVGWDTHLGTDGDRFIPQPSAISLSAYPNPFNHFLRIEYGVSRTQAVNLSVFNVLGQRVATLHDGLEQAGTHVMDWSPQTSGGVYFLNLRTPDATRTSKVLFIP